jgi:hypothetical protein
MELLCIRVRKNPRAPGVGTLHAGSGIGALRRLEQLIQEALIMVPRALVAETARERRKRSGDAIRSDSGSHPDRRTASYPRINESTIVN